MKFVTIVLTLTLVSLVMSVQIFPLPNPPPTTAPAAGGRKVDPIEYKKYYGLTAGLLPGAKPSESTDGSSLELLETAEGSHPEKTKKPAKDLLPPKLKSANTNA